MRKYGGYTHFDFFNEDRPFHSSTYFELIDSIRREIDKEEKEMKKAQKGEQ